MYNWVLVLLSTHDPEACAMRQPRWQLLEAADDRRRSASTWPPRLGAQRPNKHTETLIVECIRILFIEHGIL